jgi:hypothetical protein
MTITVSGSSLTFNDSTTQDTAKGTAKAWLNYNGSTNNILGSFNVSSVTVNGTGDYSVNFTTAMPSTGYAVTGMSGTPSTADTVCDFVAGSGTVTNTGSVRFGVRTFGGAYYNATIICISVFSA